MTNLYPVNDLNFYVLNSPQYHWFRHSVKAIEGIVFTIPIENIHMSSSLISAMNVYEMDISGNHLHNFETKQIQDSFLLQSTNGLNSLNITNLTISNVTNIMKPMLVVKGEMYSEPE